jgi:heme/copper-type cytochrome/quinol oxidase subunit 3
MTYHAEAGYRELRNLVERNLWAGVRLWVGADAFFFLGFVFAFFYLRALDSNDMFRDPHDHQSTAVGTAVLVATVGCAVMVRYGVARLRSGDGTGWRRAAAVALVLAVAAVVLQIVQFDQFGLDRKVYQGYGSIFLGWTIAYVIHLVGAGAWLESLFAQSVRERGLPAAGASVLPSAAACLVFWEFMAVVGAIMYVLLYLV